MIVHGRSTDTVAGVFFLETFFNQAIKIYGNLGKENFKFPLVLLIRMYLSSFVLLGLYTQ